MILIITHKEDFTADYIIDILNQRQIDYFRLNCEDILEESIDLRFGQASIAELFNGSDIHSVWYRRTKLPAIETSSKEEQLYLLKEADAFLANLFSIIPGKWLSDPAAVHRSENKLLQLRIANELGLLVPETMVTTSKKSLIDFYNSQEKIVIKPLNTGRIDYMDGRSKMLFSNIVSKEKIDKLNLLKLTPSIFQAYIEKDYELRVTIVGEEIFAAKVLSQSDPDTMVDWRRKPLRFFACEFPEKTGSQCKEMMKRLGIAFGAFDFIKTKEDQYYFLEVNPNGQWVWIENDTGLKISEAIINYLVC